jgi:hypothetical protein
LPQRPEDPAARLLMPRQWLSAGLATCCLGVLMMSQTLGAADSLERLRADVPVGPRSSAVKVTNHGVPAVAPNPDPGQQPRTLLELFSSWVKQDDATTGDPAPPVKVEPSPRMTQSGPMPEPEGTDRDAIVPIDPAPSAALVAATTPLDGMVGQFSLRPVGTPGAEPLSVLTNQLVSTSLVTAALWGKSSGPEEGPRDELDRLASPAARQLDRGPIPAPRRLVERARPPLKAGRVSTSQDGVDHLMPIEPASGPIIN